MLPLVSIITPCYNGESYLKRFYESILEQALYYKPKIENKGYSFKYIFQNNAGQAAAINAV